MNRLKTLEGPIERYTITSGSPSQTIDIGKRLGRLVPEGSVISLEGGLGAGKTLIAKGICAGLGVDEEVVSPSFILVEEYSGDFNILHFDLYRLDRFEEVERVGLFDAVDGRNVVIVEWGDKLPEGSLVPDVRLIMRIAKGEEREIIIEACKELTGAIMGGES
ncbi:MAG: tRNA (adenosine(37)-N6)-threonylcarbamoyltransferase complex ATPase subunit type 1 TsaE [Candidatus Krumholzibacteria bacterium]|nr:tRNA (adenosine(37)-N6)-threonylcarbamoyltransferase complex ATPase subunit type 1 TsaE [Candidatus Krumholzibacteria bacterium]